MIQGTDVHEGMLLLIEGKVYKAISASLKGVCPGTQDNAFRPEEHTTQPFKIYNALSLN